MDVTHTKIISIMHNTYIMHSTSVLYTSKHSPAQPGTAHLTESQQKGGKRTKPVVTRDIRMQAQHAHVLYISDIFVLHSCKFT